MFRTWLSQMEPPWAWGAIYGIGIAVSLMASRTEKPIESAQTSEPARSSQVELHPQLVER